MWNQPSFYGGGSLPSYQGYQTLQNPAEQRPDPESFYGFGGAPPGANLPGGAPPPPTTMLHPMASAMSQTTQAGMGQSADPGSTRFWDRDYSWQTSFPEKEYAKMKEEKHKREEALAEKVLSMQPHVFTDAELDDDEPPVKMMAPKADPRISKTRIILVICTLLIVGLVLLEISLAHKALGNPAFNIFTALAADAGYPGMSTVVVTVVAIACLAIVVALLNLWMGFVRAIPLLRMNAIFMAILGVVLVSLSAFSFFYQKSAEPHVIRAANLICQDTQVWGCELVQWEAATTVTTTRVTQSQTTTTQFMPQLVPHRLYEADWGSGSSRPMPRSLAEAVHGYREEAVSTSASGLRGAGDGARRLATTAANAAMAFLKSFMFPGANEQQVCSQIAQICVPPPGFNSAVACVCNGEWELVPTTTTTTTTTVTSSTTTTTSTTTSTSTATKTSSTTTTPTTTLDEKQAYSNMVDGLQGARRRLFDAPPPWNNTQGAYCEPWSAHRQTSWCFVNANQECKSGTPVTYDNDEGQSVTRSSGPCADDVDSRSAIVLEGREPTKWFYIASAVMGLVLVVLGVTFLQISRRMKYAFREDRKANADYEVSMREEAVRTAEAARYYKPEISPELQKKFDQAQQLALQKVRETTPWHQKLTIFGLYHQALEGDVHQSRPGFLDRQERSKYDAWARHRGMSRTEAMQRYIEAVNYIESNN